MELHLPTGKKNGPMTPRLTRVNRGRPKKPSFSTSKESLEKVEHLHPLPGVILEFRKLGASVNKLIVPLLKECVFQKDLQVSSVC